MDPDVSIKYRMFEETTNVAAARKTWSNVATKFGNEIAAIMTEISGRSFRADIEVRDIDLQYTGHGSIHIMEKDTPVKEGWFLKRQANTLWKETARVTLSTSKQGEPKYLSLVADAGAVFSLVDGQISSDRLKTELVAAHARTSLVTGAPKS